MKFKPETAPTMSLTKNPLALACSLAFAVVAGSAHADQADDMQAKLDGLQKQVAELQTQMSAMASKAQKQEEKAVASPAIRTKPGDGLTFQVGDSSEVTLYGHVDVSVDYQTNGLRTRSVQPATMDGWATFPAIFRSSACVVLGNSATT